MIALMAAMPVSAGEKTTTFYDRTGDLGTAFFSAGQGSHDWGDPLGWWSGESPIGNAGYLDMLSGWVSVKAGTVTMGLTLASALPTDGELPQSVVQVMWGWFFYQSTDVYYGGTGSPYAVYVTWDGMEYNAVLVDRTDGTMPYDVTNVDFAIEGNVVTVKTSTESLAGAVAWFSETIAMRSSPYPLDGVHQGFGGWMAPDLTDYQGSLATYWPWQAMP